MNTFFQLLPLLIFLSTNVIFGIIAMKMAARRGLMSAPAFWSGIFGSAFALFFIAMHPIQENK